MSSSDYYPTEWSPSDDADYVEIHAMSLRAQQSAHQNFTTVGELPSHSSGLDFSDPFSADNSENALYPIGEGSVASDFNAGTDYGMVAQQPIMAQQPSFGSANAMMHQPAPYPQGMQAGVGAGVGGALGVNQCSYTRVNLGRNAYGGGYIQNQQQGDFAPLPAVDDSSDAGAFDPVDSPEIPFTGDLGTPSYVPEYVDPSALSWNTSNINAGPTGTLAVNSSSLYGGSTGTLAINSNGLYGDHPGSAASVNAANAASSSASSSAAAFWTSTLPPPSFPAANPVAAGPLPAPAQATAAPAPAPRPSGHRGQVRGRKQALNWHRHRCAMGNDPTGASGCLAECPLRTHTHQRANGVPIQTHAVRLAERWRDPKTGLKVCGLWEHLFWDLEQLTVVGVPGRDRNKVPRKQSGPRKQKAPRR